MTKAEIVDAIAKATSVEKITVQTVVEAFMETVENALAENEPVYLRGFGSFKIKEYEGYAGRNPKTGESVDVVPKRLPFFRAGKELKEFINQ